MNQINRLSLALGGSGGISRCEIVEVVSYGVSPKDDAVALGGMEQLGARPRFQIVDPDPTEFNLVCAAVRGDMSASEQLYMRCAPDLLRWVSRVVLGSVEAEDIIQDTFVTAFGAIKKLKQPLAFRSWLKSIAVTQIRRRFRRQRLLRRLGFASVDPVDIEAVVTSDAPPDVVAELRELIALLQKLPVEEGLALSLQRVHGCGLEEIAELMHLSIATVKRRLVSAELQLSALREVQP